MRHDRAPARQTPRALHRPAAAQRRLRFLARTRAGADSMRYSARQDRVGRAGRDRRSLFERRHAPARAARDTGATTSVSREVARETMSSANPPAGVRTLIPIPATTPSPDPAELPLAASHRTPATFLPPTMTSFGHSMPASIPGATRSTARAAASPTISGRDVTDAREAGTRTDIQRPDPGGECPPSPGRPRPQRRWRGRL